MHKLQQFGISGKLGIWLHCFLTNRQQAVCVMGEISSKTWVTSGVPQGSVLGPLLFSILISDINSGVSISNLLSYADDTKIYTGISDSQDESMLQTDLSHIYDWAKLNNQEFNTKKFEAIRFSLNSDLCSYLNPKSLSIENKSVVKDLGIFFPAIAPLTSTLTLSLRKARNCVDGVFGPSMHAIKTPCLHYLNT